MLHERAELAFHDLHGEPLYGHALRALIDAVGPGVVGADTAELDRVRRDVERWRLAAEVREQADWFAEVRRRPAAGLLIHDVLCPLVTADFLATMSARADAQPAAALVAVRPVTDTLKKVVEDRIEQTIDRESLVSITSPVVLPPRLLTDPDDDPPVADFAALVGWLRARGGVELVRAPSLGRRVEHARGVHLLECLDEVGHRVRAGGGRSAPGDRP